ncbi:uncharacterized protein EV422DRAFT_530436 [Fimicolochytrium jonesii]|uniref:uncharacterized protein n=1 Tax=Fimicolochytrium jonesii TaxID=1396493 RepID=UPI0022FE6D50|nr:uncharacterized protein EV422DRAFT_530436 [Fimicolochytrium jonesii]KAI8820846.1 hypothetical protein EV422DRAFT_530436 [Fimicolochytrium jonesii]
MPKEMDAFKHAYLAKCSELAIDPHRALTDLLLSNRPLAPASDRVTTTAKTIDLRGQSLTLKECAALSTALSHDVYFSRVILADTFLNDEGCILIAGGLKTNHSVTHLDVRGNSIRADGALALAQMLKVNGSLKSLVMEWNCIGIWQAGIRSLADALAVNQTLEDLDLRNNSIGPDGAQTLAVGLRNNQCLRRLDLRWNHIGLLGSKAIADLLKWNTTLEEIQLNGNEVPEEMAKVIAVALDRNASARKHTLLHLAHASDLAQTVSLLDANHRDVLTDLRSDLLAKQKQLDAACRNAAKSSEAYRVLEGRLRRMEREAREVGDGVGREREELRRRLEEVARELGAEREAHHQTSLLLSKSQSDTKRTQLELDSVRCDADARIEGLKQDLKRVVEELERAREKGRTREVLWDEQAKRTHAEHEEAIRAAVAATESEWRGRVQKLEEKLRRVESSHTTLEEDLQTLKSKHTLENRQWADKLSAAETQARRDAAAHQTSLEKTITTLQTQLATLQATHDALLPTHARLTAARDALAAQLAAQTTEITSLRAQLSDATTHLTSAQSASTQTEARLASLTAELATARSQLTQRDAETARLRAEIHRTTSEVGRLEAEVGRWKREAREREEEGVKAVEEIVVLVSERARRRRGDVR